MRARKIKRTIDAGGNVIKRDLVFFGSYGLNPDGTAKFYNENDKNNSFSEHKEAVADTLLVKLNILEGELWYAINEGWPLWSNHKNKYVLDMYVTSVVLREKNVVRIERFNSDIKRYNNNKYLTYVAELVILTEFGEVNISINQNI